MNGTRAAAPSAIDEALRSESDRIEALLEDVAGMAGPQTWERIEELVTRLVGLYGAGLGRLLGHIEDSGVLGPELRGAICRDELVSSLLTLHGLHPSPVLERVEQALDDVRPYLSSHAGDVELVSIDELGTLRLRLLGSCQGCPSSSATVDALLREVVEAAAPEIAGIEVVPGADAASASGGGDLIGIGIRRSHARAPQRWIDLEGTARIAAGELEAFDVEGVAVLAVRLHAGLVAYLNACAGCNTGFDRSALDGDRLRCGECGASFDLARGGRSDDPLGPHLEPLPLLEHGSGARLALSGQS